MDDQVLVATVFWASLLIVLYTYFGYPSLLFVWTRRRTRPVKKSLSFEPPVSLLIVAHNEEQVLRRKLENALELDYPKNRLEFLVASDGSTDRTNEVVREFEDKGVVLLAFPVRRGKASTLNEAVPMCRGEIVVLSDARQVYDREAIRELVGNFHDPEIGAVTGDLQFCPGAGNVDGEKIGLYWKYEKWIRRFQSAVDSIPAVTGAIYAIRKSLFRPLPPGSIADDLAMPMNMVMQGYRVVYDSNAKAYDNFLRTMREEFRKRVRTIAGSYQFLYLAPAVLNPKRNRIWLHFFSHKILRVLAPFFLMALLSANSALSAWPYRVFLALQLAFYAAAVAGLVLTNQGKGLKILSAPSTFLMLNAAACVALFRLVTGTQTHLWEKNTKGITIKAGEDGVRTKGGAPAGMAGL